jgi:hypothetical protein
MIRRVCPGITREPWFAQIAVPAHRRSPVRSLQTTRGNLTARILEFL